jgi:hypothetical protein
LVHASASFRVADLAPAEVRHDRQLRAGVDYYVPPRAVRGRAGAVSGARHCKGRWKSPPHLRHGGMLLLDIERERLEPGGRARRGDPPRSRRQRLRVQSPLRVFLDICSSKADNPADSLVGARVEVLDAIPLGGERPNQTGLKFRDSRKLVGKGSRMG